MELKGPSLYGTDHGSCCFFSPHVNMDTLRTDISYGQIFHQAESKAKHGAANGLDIIFDAEIFNYAYYRAEGAGKI